MSESIVERVARKMAELDGRDPDGTDGGPCHMGLWTDEGEPFWAGYVEAARTLLSEMREPTDAMLDGGYMESMPLDGAVAYAIVGNIYRAMIDAALSETETPPYRPRAGAAPAQPRGENPDGDTSGVCGLAAK